MLVPAGDTSRARRPHEDPLDARHMAWSKERARPDSNGGTCRFEARSAPTTRTRI